MSDGMGRELAYLSSHATNRYFIPNWGILLSFHTLCCIGGNTITTAKQPTLDDLDKVISASKEYTKKYEQEVGILSVY